MLYDLLLVIALWMATLFPIVAIANHAVHGATIQTLLFLEAYAFFVLFWRYRGQTLGMLAWKLAIRSEDGAPLSLSQATLRFFGALVSAACLGLGYLWILIDRENRSWGDLISRTRVVRTLGRPREP